MRNMGYPGPDDLGDRMKMLESIHAGEKFMPLLPVIVRIDGRSFHTFTVGLERPFDVGFVNLMRAVTRHLVEQTNARIGYCQSDEITLVLYSDSYASEIFFNGRIQKLVSVIASMATTAFVLQGPLFIRRHDEEWARVSFDCRAYTVPTLWEAANAVLWREQDAAKNSVQMLARAHFSHKELHGKKQSDMQEMLFQKGYNWNDLAAPLKRGSFYQRRTVNRPFAPEEIDRLPPKHDARQNPNLSVERSDVVLLTLPKFSSVTNRVDVIFHEADPIIPP